MFCLPANYKVQPCRSNIGQYPFPPLLHTNKYIQWLYKGLDFRIQHIDWWNVLNVLGPGEMACGLWKDLGSRTWSCSKLTWLTNFLSSASLLTSSQVRQAKFRFAGTVVPQAYWIMPIPQKKGILVSEIRALPGEAWVWLKCMFWSERQVNKQFGAEAESSFGLWW